MIIAATGHRPDKLGGYGNPVASQRLMDLAADHIDKARPAKVISGMALGWDTAFGWAAVHLRIPLIAAVPFRGQESRWPVSSQTLYRLLLDRAEDVVVVCDGGYAVWKLQKRNEWMVDHADRMCALWDGSAGGTRNCVEYALNKGKPVTTLYQAWKAMSGKTTGETG
jgi:uncharacterized phage-like protein YoqJ